MSKFILTILILFFSLSIFAQSDTETFTDKRDGNTYNIISIGKQKWMGENLRYLPDISPAEEGYLYEIHYYVYGYNGTDIDSAKASANYSEYGVLYNFLAAKKACPFGWRLPSEKDWKELETVLNNSQTGSYMASKSDLWDDGKMKKAACWGESKFNAMPAGYRDGNGFFAECRKTAYFWTSKQEKQTYAFYRYIENDETYLGHEHGGWDDAYSIRCVKN